MNIEKKTIERWIEAARGAGIIGPAGFDAAELLYPGSVRQKDRGVFALLKMPGISHDGPAFAWDRELGPEFFKALHDHIEGYSRGGGEAHRTPSEDPRRETRQMKIRR